MGPPCNLIDECPLCVTPLVEPRSCTQTSRPRTNDKYFHLRAARQEGDGTYLITRTVLKATVAEGAEQFDILERVGDQNMAEYAATCVR